MLSSEVVKRLFDEGDVLGLKMLVGSTEGVFYFRVKTVEGPNDLDDFSLGSASAQNSTGSDWVQIQDASSRYILEPVNENIIYQVFYGIHPAYAWLYRRYPTNVDRGSLIGTRTVGDRTYRVGKIDGFKSPYRTPSPETEFFTMKGLHPSFLGYHPYLEPASITVRMNFFVVRYGVDKLDIPSSQEKEKAKVRTMGGESLMQAPSWLR